MAALSRRAFIGAGFGLVVAAGVGVPIALSGRPADSTGSQLVSRAPIPAAFRRALTIPAVLSPFAMDKTTDHYRIVQRRAMAGILPGLSTPVWGYNGTFPGPTIVSRRGRTTSVTHTNELPVPTVVHLHGGHTPPESDGYPIDVVYPVGQTAADWRGMHDRPDRGDTAQGARTYTYPLDQRAATLWYHDHRMDFTGPSVWRGLAGFHIVTDDEEDALGLPSGARDVPLMLTDRSFRADGSLLYPSIDATLREVPGVTGDYVAGVLGDVMLVNGTPWPVLAVDRATYRFRILNACNARRLDLRLDPSPADGMVQIGTDGGLLERPIPQSHIEAAPAQRYDVLVDFSRYPPGTAVTMRNDFGDGRMSEVMRFVVGDRDGERFAAPARLSTIAPLSASDAVVTRTLRFQAGAGAHSWLIDGEPFSPDAVAANVRLGSVEVWRLVADFHHPVHLHLNPFQVLSRGSGGPGAFDAGWKDTIDLRPSEVATIAIRFDGYRGRYVFHCHNLEHEDMAMMANFVID
jgi:spore coat protein A